jgi:hypothetical protein
VPDLSVRTQVIGADDVPGIDFVPLYELVNFDGPRGFQRDVFELFLGDFDVGVGVDLMCSAATSSPVSASTVCPDNLNAGVAVMKSAQDGA